MTAAPPPLLRIQDLHVRFGGKTVVQGIHLEIAPGEKLALVGESGSGKSITALALLRLTGDATLHGHAWLRQSDGRELDVLQLGERSMQHIRGEDIAMVFQEPMTALNPLMRVGDQIAEVLRLKKALPPAQALEEAVALLHRTGLPDAPRRARAWPHQLSGGQRQRAVIAMALACQPRLLLADEPTTALDVSLRAQMLELIDGLRRDTGMAVLLITHDLPLVRRFADRVAVMQHGRIVETAPASALFAAPQHPYTRQLLSSTPPRNVAPVAPQAPLLVRAEHLGVRYPQPVRGPGSWYKGWWRKNWFEAVKDASLRLHAGQTLGIVGESGSGKSTLAQAILGLLPASGTLQLADGRSWQHPPTRNTAHNRALRQQVQVVFQDPFSALSPRMTVEEIISEGLHIHGLATGPEARNPTATAPAHASAPPARHDRAAAVRQRVLEVLRDVGLDEARFPGLLQRYPHEFSGGQRQRLAIARALIVRPRVLVLDEPTSALDVTIQQQVLALLQHLQRTQALGYVLITHDMDVIRAMAHEVLVMQDGRIVEHGPVQAILQRPQHPYTRQLIAAAAPS